MALLRRGLQGEPVRILQEHLGITADGVFGQATYNAVIAYQNQHGLSPDGIAGPDTFYEMGLLELVQLHKPIKGVLVKRLQEALQISADGHFGNGTEAAVKQVQEANGLEVDGIAGPQTLQYVPGFDEFAPKVDASLVTENTPELDSGAADIARGEMAAAPLTEPEGAIAHAAHAVTDVAANVGKSIWNTVKSIF
jgi:murein L,D-transpeptidase YcbB/YkuD